MPSRFSTARALPENEVSAAALLQKAARKGNPVAQNRLANILAVGRGLKADPVEAIKWHTVAKAGGVSDIPLDAFVEKQTPEIRSAAEKAAKHWLDTIKQARESALLTSQLLRAQHHVRESDMTGRERIHGFFCRAHSCFAPPSSTS